MVNPLPNSNMLDVTKLKALGRRNSECCHDDLCALSIEQKTLWEKGENAGYQHFLLFPTVFSKPFFFRVVESRDCVVKS